MTSCKLFILYFSLATMFVLVLVICFLTLTNLLIKFLLMELLIGNPL